MGLLSLGGGKSKSSSFSESSSFDNLDQFGFNLGVSRSSNVSESSAVSTGRAGAISTQGIAFEDLFANLFGDASNVAGRLAGDSTLTRTANDLFSSGAGFLDTLASGGAGAEFLEERLAGGDSIADEQIALLSEDLGKFFEEEINPAITARGVQAGTLGGGRGEVSKGIASEALGREFARGAVDIRSREQAARDAIASTLLADETQRGVAGIAGAQSLFGLAEQGFLSELAPFAALSQIIGDPTVLTQAESFDVSDSSSISRALAEAFGFDLGVDQTVGRGGSQSKSSSSSSAKEFSIGF